MKHDLQLPVGIWNLLPVWYYRNKGEVENIYIYTGVAKLRVIKFEFKSEFEFELGPTLTGSGVQYQPEVECQVSSLAESFH